VWHLYYKFTTSVRDRARVRHRRPTGPGPALPDFHRPGPPWGVLGRVHHRRSTGSLVPSTGGAGTTVLWFPAWAECGLEEERCTAVGERRGGGGGGQRREEKRREILIGAYQDQDFFFSVATLSCFQTRSSVSGFLSLALLRKANHEAKTWRRWWWWC